MNALGDEGHIFREKYTIRVALLEFKPAVVIFEKYKIGELFLKVLEIDILNEIGQI